MKTGECIKLIHPDGVAPSVNWLTIWKEGKGSYRLVLEHNSRMSSKVVNSSAQVRKIIKLAESEGYVKQKGSVELDE